MSIQDNWNNIYIKNKAEDYKNSNEYSNAKKYLGFYYGKVELNLAYIFSYLHYKVNSSIRFIQKSPERGYINDDLREPLKQFVSLIDEITEIKENVTNSIYSFQMDADYDKTLTLCAKIIVEKLYLFIPDGFENIKLVENRPLFFLQSSINISQNKKAELRLFGQGSYAQVFKYKDPYYNRYFVVKRALKELNEQELKRFETEFEVMKKLRSPHVIEVYHYDKENHEYVMEHVDETLDKYYLQNNSTLSFNQRRNFVLQILDAFTYIHSKDIMHRDISTSNILVKKYEDKILLKVSDFGLVKQEDSNLTNLQTELKGRFNDPKLELIGFKNYKMHHETYALTRLIYFIITGRTVLGSYKSNEFKDFVSRGLSDNENERYADVDELRAAFMNISNTLREVLVR
ncbi:serine/threonine protein kinase [Priestia megaterium]|nr:serine/threonine protein kinase [Priestia megaterium]